MAGAAAVAQASSVVAVYVHSPEDDGEWRPGAASDWWLHHSLLRLDEALRRRGIALTVRRGPPARELPAVAAETGASGIYWNRLYEPATVARDGAKKTEAGTGAQPGGLAVEAGLREDAEHEGAVARLRGYRPRLGLGSRDRQQHACEQGGEGLQRDARKPCAGCRRE